MKCIDNGDSEKSKAVEEHGQTPFIQMYSNVLVDLVKKKKRK